MTPLDVVRLTELMKLGEGRAALAHAPGVLDFYLWLVWKSWTVNGQPASIPMIAAGGLNEQLGTSEYSLDRRFCHTIVGWLKKVKAFWPDCPAVVTNDRRFLVVHSSRKSPAIRPATNQYFICPANSS